jgi:hypothetical protein
MKSITNKDTYDQIAERINKLTPESKPEWGKMNVIQMIVHCTTGLKMSTGEVKPKSKFFVQLLGRLLKKRIFAQESLRRNAPTSQGFIIVDDRNFDEEKSILLSYLNKCLEKGKTIFTNEPHPFFGKLTAEEWDGLMYKHIDHHLKQFKV